jgi:hypothetical protein
MSLILPELVEDPVKIFSSSRMRRSLTSPVPCRTARKADRHSVFEKFTTNLVALPFPILRGYRKVCAADNRKPDDFVAPE